MRYIVRPMELRDVLQVAEIEREAFPPPWPATNFKRELMSNSLVQYFVACVEGLRDKERGAETVDMEGAGSHGAGFESFKAGLRRLFGLKPSPAAPTDFVLGFAGLWFMADEAHLSNIAVRQAYRRRGIGERLFIEVIEFAIKRKARFITLEVRASNKAAQALYRKYGLVEVGMRRGYYVDNKEDALIMTAEAITSPAYLALFEKLKEAHTRRWAFEASAPAK